MAVVARLVNCMAVLRRVPGAYASRLARLDIQFVLKLIS